MSWKRDVADAMVTAIAARSYMTSNSVAVRRWAEQDAKSAKQALVMVGTPERLEPNSDYFRVPLQMQAVTKIADDEDGADNDGIYADLLAWFQAQTAATLSTLTSKTIDGIVPQLGDEEPTDDYHTTFIIAELYATIS